MTDIVVVGGGFAGLNAALAAARVGEGRLKITLVSRDPWLTIRPRLYECDPQSLTADLRAPLAAAGVSFVQADAQGLEADSLVLASGAALRADRLVVATGSVMQLPAIPGAEHACSIDDLAAATAFDRRLAALATKPDQTIVIIGAGFTGIELALEMRDRIAAHAGGAVAENARVVLVDQNVEPGADLGAGPRPAIEEALAAARVELRLGVRIAAIGVDNVTLRDGARIDCDAVVMCTGLRAAPFVAHIPGEKDSLGRLVADEFLRAPGAPGIFVAGDAVCATPSPGRTTLMSCQHALMLGKFAGENAARDALGMPLIAYAQPRYVTCLALGRSGAVFSEGWERVPVKTGAEAGAIKTEINRRRIYPPEGTRAEILAASRI